MSNNFLNRFKNKIETMDRNGFGEGMKNNRNSAYRSEQKVERHSPQQVRGRVNTDAIKKNFLEFPATYGQIVNPQYMAPPPIHNFNPNPIPYMPYQYQQQQQYQYQPMHYYPPQNRSKSNYRVN